jgi:hypothetical protein
VFGYVLLVKTKTNIYPSPLFDFSTVSDWTSDLLYKRECVRVTGRYRSDDEIRRYAGVTIYGVEYGKLN